MTAGQPRRRTRREARPVYRAKALRNRMDGASNGRAKVSAACAHLRSVLADPHLPAELADEAADRTVTFLVAMATELEKAAASTKGKK
jgi:hypothetical protein